MDGGQGALTVLVALHSSFTDGDLRYLTFHTDDLYVPFVVNHRLSSEPRSSSAVTLAPTKEHVGFTRRLLGLSDCIPATVTESIIGVEHHILRRTDL